MSKYTFVLLRKGQKEFLESLQELGLVDISSADLEITEDERAMLFEFERYASARSYFKELAKLEGFKEGEPYADGKEAFAKYLEAGAVLEELRGRIEKTHKEVGELTAWGDFNPSDISRLAASGVVLRFFSVPAGDYSEIEAKYGDEFMLKLVSEVGGRKYFVLIQTEDTPELLFDAQEHKTPQMNVMQKREELEGLEAELQQWQAVMGRAFASRDAIEQDEIALKEHISFSRAVKGGTLAADDSLVILEGWATQESTGAIDAMLESCTDVYSIKDKPTPEDDAPVVLKNNKFASPFEIIGGFYALPKYGTIDLTAFFGPFYMIFFGFCLGDAGYGLVLLLGSFFLRGKSKFMNQAANLTLLCGAAAVVFGFMIGSFFGVGLAGLKMFEGIREKFIDTDMLFNLALGMGGVQIIFALILNIINTSRQFGFRYSFGTLGWLLILLGAIGMMGLPMIGVTSVPAIVFYVVIGIGAVLMLILNHPKRNVFANFGMGLWNMYNNVTGLLGDILSYIRLFALCLSGGTLALVFNDLAFGLTADMPIVAKQIAIVLILIFGHGINLFMSSLGALVHPMRLTFVEFYKNAGFESTLREFSPLKKSKKQ